MPDRDYYLSTSPHMTGLRKQYQAHIQAMFQLAGYDKPAERAARAFALETKMAGVHATRVESEDVHTAVQWKRDDLAANAPGLDWPTLLTAAGLNDAPVFFIWHPKAVPDLSKLAATESLDSWKDWLALHAIERSAAFLPKAFVDERFHFYGQVLSGVPEQRPRWQRGMD
jgi:putative endopeptidase